MIKEKKNKFYITLAIGVGLLMPLLNACSNETAPKKTINENTQITASVTPQVTASANSKVVAIPSPQVTVLATPQITASANIKPPMNLSQIQAGDYSSLMGTWKGVACAINAQDGNGNQWRYKDGSKNSNESDITVTNNALTFFNGSCAFEGNTFTENIGKNNVRAHQLKFRIDNGSLIAEITDSNQVAINWWFLFYPKGTTNDYGTNNGVKIDNTKNVIIVYCTNNTRASAFEQE